MAIARCSDRFHNSAEPPRTKGRGRTIHALVIILMAIPLVLMTARLEAQPPAPSAPGTEGDAVELLNRGPLHESFAEVDAGGHEAGILVTKAPPAPIKEVPPEVRPEGEDVEWLPGYWGWDEDQGDFLWISGVWRKIPPGRRWVPGYWVEAEGGYRWVSGFWAEAAPAESELQYLPYPPESLESGPSSPAPGDDYFYVPGSWQYVTHDYQWRPGYWANSYSQWVWVPQRYIWTPRGCIFRPGYWDYLPDHRGCFFAPVRFRSPIYLQASYRYTPRIVVDCGPAFFVHLFVRPRYCHYYFGDYYADRYRQRQIYPWVDLWTSHRRYDPLYAYYQGRGASQSVFLTRIHDWNRYYRSHPEHRPHHHWGESPRDFRNPDILRMTSFSASFQQFVGSGRGDRSFVTLTPQAREEFHRHSDPFRHLQRQRAEFESRLGAARTPREGQGAARDLPRFRLPEQTDHERRAAEWSRAMGPRPEREPRSPFGDGGRRPSRETKSPDREDSPVRGPRPEQPFPPSTGEGTSSQPRGNDREGPRGGGANRGSRGSVDPVPRDDGARPDDFEKWQERLKGLRSQNKGPSPRKDGDTRDGRSAGEVRDRGGERRAGDAGKSGRIEVGRPTWEGGNWRWTDKAQEPPVNRGEGAPPGESPRIRVRPGREAPPDAARPPSSGEGLRTTPPAERTDVRSGSRSGAGRDRGEFRSPAATEGSPRRDPGISPREASPRRIESPDRGAGRTAAERWAPRSRDPGTAAMSDRSRPGRGPSQPNATTRGPSDRGGGERSRPTRDKSPRDNAGDRERRGK